MLGHPDDPRGVALPLDGQPGIPAPQAPARPARARPAPFAGTPVGPALLLSWRPAGPTAAGEDRAWGRTLSASSELARRLARPGAARGPEQGLTVRVTLPEAFGAEPVFRLAGAEALPSSPGPSQLQPVGAPGGGPAPGAELGLLTLVTAVEIATISTQHRVLEALTAAVGDLLPECPMQVDSRLRAAEESLRAAQTELLEHGVISSEAELDTTTANLSVLRHKTHAWISGWERVVGSADRTGTSGNGVRERLGEVGRLGWPGFPAAILGAYQALVLDARRILLSAADHQLRSPDRPLPALRPLVESDLSGRAADVTRLHRLLTDLSVLPLTVRKRSSGMLPHLIADQATANARTQALFTRMADALRPPAWTGEVAVEVQTLPGGELQVLRPA